MQGRIVGTVSGVHIILGILVRVWVRVRPRMAEHKPELEPVLVPVQVWPRTRQVLIYIENMYGSYVRMKFGSTRKQINGAQIIVLTISSNCCITIRKAHPRSRLV